MSFEKGDCTFVKMTTESICSPQNIAFTPEEYLKIQLYYFLNKNPKALGFWQQISRIQMGGKKRICFWKTKRPNFFFFLVLFKNLGKMEHIFHVMERSLFQISSRY